MKPKKSTNTQRISQLEKAVTNLYALLMNYNNMVTELAETKKENVKDKPDN